MNSEKDGGNLVQAVRAWHGLPQEQFASRLGVSFASVNRWESGRVTPPRLTRMQIEDLLRGLAADDEDLLHEFFGQGTRPGKGKSPGGQ